MNTKLIFALHFHQPTGNFDSVFEAAIAQCYRPIVEHFERHPGVTGAFHFSGCLLEWLEKHDRAFLTQVFRLIGSKQIEPMGGGFYEPILTVIPRDDAMEQIALLSQYWQERCGVKPTGAWLTERVWEQGLAELLADAGIRYTILDDQHLRLSGLLDSRFTGYYTTERVGRGIACFPSDFKLRYFIPFRTIQTVKEHFAELARSDRPLALTYGDDAEKFGFWPGTHKWVYEEKWLEQFFALLEDSGSPVRTEKPGAYLEAHAPTARVYIPNASYSEMLEWALPSASVPVFEQTRKAARKGASQEAVESFVRGPLWDMFLARYPESNQIHKHMIHTSRRVLERAKHESLSPEARTSILRAQCNCGYWHGLFGGIYLTHLRHGLYENILAADALLARDLHGRVDVKVEDFDGDFEDEVILRSHDVQAFFRPADGGTLVELDYLPRRFNVSNVVSRWKESYHEGQDLTHEQAGSQGVLSPHESPVGIDPTVVRNAHFDRLPLRGLRDFTSTTAVDEKVLFTLEGLSLSEGPPLDWSATPNGWRARHALKGITYERIVQMSVGGTIDITYRFEGVLPDRGWFGTLLPLTLLAREANDRVAIFVHENHRESRAAPGAARCEEKTLKLMLEDRAFGFALDVEPSEPAKLAAIPIETLHRSEASYKTEYQGTIFGWSWPWESLKARDRQLKLKISFRPLSG